MGGVSYLVSGPLWSGKVSCRVLGFDLARIEDFSYLPVSTLQILKENSILNMGKKMIKWHNFPKYHYHRAVTLDLNGR